VLKRIVPALEGLFFTWRKTTLGIILCFTAVMAFYALQLRMEAGFEKQMPIGHEYIQTFQKYRGQLFGANRLTIVVKAKHGDIWNTKGLTRLYDVTQAVIYLPFADRLGVQSLWTPNTFVNSISEDGFRATPVIESKVTPDRLNAEIIRTIRDSTRTGGYIGTLVSRDQTSAMITAELNEVDADGRKLDYVSYNAGLEKLRSKFEDADFDIQIIGFAKQIGDIADGARAVLEFFAVALLLTAAAVFWYCRSVRFTVLPIFCSLTSLVWQFGTLSLLHYGLDPLAVLVPFLVFAIGVSHGVQQINFIVREIAHGRSTFEAGKNSFSQLLVPGTLALVTAFVSFITLLAIPIPMVRELAITASIGVGYKIITNLIMLPVAASFFSFSRDFAARAMLERERRSGWLRGLARLAEPRNATIVLSVTGVIFMLAVWESRDRVIGTLQPGAPELRADSRFNRDALAVSESYDVGLDWLTVVFEAPANSYTDVAFAKFEDDFVWEIGSLPDVVSVSSFTGQLRTYNEGYNESNPKMATVPIDATNLAGLATQISFIRGFVNSDGSMSAVHFYLADHKAVTINRLISAIKTYRELHTYPGVTIRLAAGNAGVLAAINEELERAELPMMLYVYAAIIALVLVAYRDWRATLACCLPLMVATFIGYWFMKELQIGLTVATLPVMVLAVGIGVDYAFYIYNRTEFHLAAGIGVVKAVEFAIMEVGMATIFTAITLAVGVATWALSPLKFQADMGKLLAFMFMINLVAAMTALPALVVTLERIAPRRGPRRAGLAAHAH
jgi:predicted RND superfamily exporter protein